MVAVAQAPVVKPKPRVPVWLIILYVLALATIVAWPILAFFILGFGFDAPGSAQNPAVWTMVISILSYPLLPLIGVPASFFAYRKGWRVPAFVLLGIGAIPLVLFVVGFIAMGVSNYMFLLSPPKF